uniref:Uncharacterized protein n=1 Tax=Arundo donax TaxID=35708 RepID=A0A0A9HBP7_ARUDO
MLEYLGKMHLPLMAIIQHGISIGGGGGPANLLMGG